MFFQAAQTYQCKQSQLFLSGVSRVNWFAFIYYFYSFFFAQPVHISGLRTFTTRPLSLRLKSNQCIPIKKKKMPDVINDTACKDNIKSMRSSAFCLSAGACWHCWQRLGSSTAWKTQRMQHNEWIHVRSKCPANRSEAQTDIHFILIVSLPDELHSRTDLQGFAQSFGSKHTHIVWLQTESKKDKRGWMQEVEDLNKIQIKVPTERY